MKRKDDSQKMLAAFKRRKAPIAEVKKDDDYCGEEEHMEECANFAEAAGFMTSEEAKWPVRPEVRAPVIVKVRMNATLFVVILIIRKLF